MDGSASFLIGKTLPPYLYSSKLQYSVVGRIMGTVAAIWFLVSAVAALFLVMGALRNDIRGLVSAAPPLPKNDETPDG